MTAVWRRMKTEARPPASKGDNRKPTASTGKKRKKPCSSKAKKGSSERRHSYPLPDPQYANMTTERLFSEGHIATGSFSYNHRLFAKEMATFNDVTIDGKPVWQKQAFGQSTLHNNVVITEYFRSLAPFLEPLAELCKPRSSTDRRFTKQRLQQYTESGRRHRDGKNAPMRVCVTDPAAPKDLKQLEIGMADASQAKGGGAFNPWQLQADGKPDARRFDCVTGSYHVMDTVATGLDSHAHHQALVKKELLLKHGALTTFVIDSDPTNPNTYIEDVAEIARRTADVVVDGISESAYVPPPTEAQIGTSSYAQKWSDYNRLQKETNLENYLQQKQDAGRANYSGEQKGREKSTKELKAEAANSCNVADCACKKGGEECTCVGHPHQSNASVGGTSGDPDKKAEGAATGPGNASGSTVPYASSVEAFPDIPLFCSKCKNDWRSFDGVKARNNGGMGVPQGILNDESKQVFLRQERHWQCGNCRCKPPEGATVTRNGVVYNVRSGTDGQFRVAKRTTT